ncbi:eukaryotic integral membrane protein-domain-containing protein [Emericellopsis atlantica]|uniref:Eukaryotic integral membrane protein-domain-containing protein n=1 Tax=Emericellopsis atlantica TaxID=2614577 RepID=A0A9P7ZTH5_9HYPO|nr:eukaryotic integral membrane protein-domain-containing protein [Emericellopsis atlantica]KAG9257477.1 eukaryotic integral membrane protein-domain-containing protein [Emericellopsis atlantica]
MARINIPPVTRVLLAGLVFQSMLSSAIRYRQWTEHAEIVIPYLTFVPQLSIVYPWTLLTTSLVESNIFTLAVGAATLYYGGRYLERAWSSRELAKFVALVTLVPNFLTFGMLVILFTLSRNESWTLTVVSGTISIQISFLVAFSQLVPAHTVTLFRGILSLRVPRFPLVHLGVVTLLSLTPALSIASFWLALFGFLTSWTYLRFYKTVFPDLEASSQSAGLRGDASETFAFAEFFPAPAKPFVAAFADQIFEALVAMRVCAPFSQADMSAARGESYLQRGTPGSARAEAERRRAIALRALDQRLHAATGTAPSRSPSQPSAQAPGGGQQDGQRSQHQANAQTATTSQPGPMLGETKFEPDHDDDEDRH